MSRIESALYTPYGAYELKATYQRNLLLSNLTVLLLISVVATTVWLVSRGDQVITYTPPPTPPETKVFFDPPPTIVRSKPVVNPAARVAPVGEIGIPVPMPDTALSDPDQVIMSIAEKASLVDWNLPNDGGAGTGRLEINTDLPDAFPPIDSFFVVEHLPELVRAVTPEYPRFAEQAGLEGTVWIKALVNTEGKVVRAVVYQSSETESLDKAALEVAWDYLYKPANQNGQPVAVWVTYRVDFQLDD